MLVVSFYLAKGRKSIITSVTENVYRAINIDMYIFEFKISDKSNS